MLAMQDQDQIVHFTLLFRPLQLTFVLSVVYAKHSPLLRRPLWQSICDFSATSTLPWMIGGDFNTFRTLDDHDGRSNPSLTTLQDFNDCIETCSLMDPPFTGSRYIWVDGRGLGRVRRRLDWLFLNSSFHDIFNDMQLQHLPRVTSDHTPLLFICRINTVEGRRSLCFLDSWLLHPDFHTYIQNAWASYPTTGGMYGFYSKLFRLKKDIQRWNKEIFGNIFSNVKQAEENLTRVESSSEDAPNEATREEYHRAKAVYLNAANYELHFLKQKARVRWLKEGHANTHYFHSIVKGRRTQQRI